MFYKTSYKVTKMLQESLTSESPEVHQGYGMMAGLTQVHPTGTVSFPSIKSYLFLALFPLFCLFLWTLVEDGEISED